MTDLPVTTDVTMPNRAAQLAEDLNYLRRGQEGRGASWRFDRKIAKGLIQHQVPSWREALAAAQKPEEITALLAESEAIPMSPDTRRKFQKACRLKIGSFA